MYTSIEISFVTFGIMNVNGHFCIAQKKNNNKKQANKEKKERKKQHERK